MIPHHRRAIRLAAATAVVLAGAACAGGRGYAPLAAPKDRSALGLAFGDERAAVERALDRAGVGHRPADGDPDALVADRCEGAPIAAPCRLLFGPEGLYAAQLEVPAGEEGALVSAVARSLGGPARRGDGTSTDGLPGLVAAWDRPGWSVAVSRPAAAEGRAVAVLHVEYERAAPPVAAGVPLGRRRGDVERVLDRQGAMLVQRDAASSTYLGCPGGDPEALSCIVSFRRGLAASVTEVHVTPPEDRAALAAWRERADRLQAEIGRAPATSCPDAGPDRIGGDCAATWGSDRLVVVVGAHRNAGSKHRGAISVYTAFTYPPLAPREGEADAETASP